MNESRGYIFIVIIGNMMHFLEYSCFPLDQVLKDIKHHLNSVNTAERLHPKPVTLNLFAMFLIT